ncbi:MAG TPA: DUF1629 domain-containing protein [Vineibacter sp.]|nr:DUF1629 domain-containing protein [Vineibacter sp.]
MAPARTDQCFLMRGVDNTTWAFDQGKVSDRGLHDTALIGIGVVENTYPIHGLPEGVVPGLQFGERLSDEHAARLPGVIGVFGTSRRPRIPPQLSRVTEMPREVNQVVSERLRSVIEELEPGVHQFIPVRYVDGRTGKPVYEDMRWFYFNVLTWIPPNELFDVHAMGTEVDVRAVHNRRKLMYFSTVKNRYVVSAKCLQSTLSGKMIWRTGSYITKENDKMVAPTEIFCRSEVMEAVKAHDIRGVRFIAVPVGST